MTKAFPLSYIFSCRGRGSVLLLCTSWGPTEIMWVAIATIHCYNTLLQYIATVHCYLYDVWEWVFLYSIVTLWPNLATETSNLSYNLLWPSFLAHQVVVLQSMVLQQSWADAHHGTRVLRKCPNMLVMCMSRFWACAVVLLTTPLMFTLYRLYQL